MRHNLDPDQAHHSPYAEDRVPPFSPQEMARIAGTQGPKSEEKAIRLTTVVQPELVYAMDRILEKRVYKLKSRHDFVRLAVMNLITQCVEEIQQEHVKTLVARLEQQRRLAAELIQMKDTTSMVVATKRTVDLFLSFNNRMEAIKALRSAKRYSEDIPYEGIRERFVNCLYGSSDGKVRPEPNAWSEAAELWHEVLEGGLDRDDEGEVAAGMKPY